ncbi:MAG TPA: ADYC domain-containing protein [Leptolyngbyaceae cyanobacterium]
MASPQKIKQAVLGLTILVLVGGSSVAYQKIQQKRLSLSHKSQQEQIVLKGKNLQGAELTAVDEQGNPLKFQIRNVELDPQDPEQEIHLYTIFYQDKQDSEWKNLCTPDRDNVAKAIPFKGTWDKKGNYIESDIVTFGCTSGNIGKCARFGYKPWKVVNGRPLRDFHQACMRMLSADYCGDGIAHTRQGTPINIYDVLEIEKPEPAPNMVFEAAWGPDGATFVNRLRWTESPTKIFQECPEKLRGKINTHPEEITMEEVLQKSPDSLIFNDSIIR